MMDTYWSYCNNNFTIHVNQIFMLYALVTYVNYFSVKHSNLVTFKAIIWRIYVFLWTKHTYLTDLFSYTWKEILKS